MDHSSLVSLMVELFAAIRLLSGYPIPANLPEVHLVSETEMQQKVCSGRPCRVKAFYHPDWGVFIDEKLDLQDDVFDRSILLHELIHHLQKTTGKFDSVASLCSKRTAQELEAYEIQNRYLSAESASRRAVVVGWAGKCEERD